MAQVVGQLWKLAKTEKTETSHKADVEDWSEYGNRSVGIRTGARRPCLVRCHWPDRPPRRRRHWRGRVQAARKAETSISPSIRPPAAIASTDTATRRPLRRVYNKTDRRCRARLATAATYARSFPDDAAPRRETVRRLFFYYYYFPIPLLWRRGNVAIRACTTKKTSFLSLLFREQRAPPLPPRHRHHIARARTQTPPAVPRT